MFTVRALDREVRDYYIVTIYCKDVIFPSRYATTELRVTVLDVNDQTPDLEGACYPMAIPENSDLSVIHTITARDDDTGPNADITYSIIGKLMKNMIFKKINN